MVKRCLKISTYHPSLLGWNHWTVLDRCIHPCTTSLPLKIHGERMEGVWNAAWGLTTLWLIATLIARVLQSDSLDRCLLLNNEISTDVKFLSRIDIESESSKGTFVWNQSGIRIILLSRSSLEPLISLDLVGTKLYCFRARVHCYHCLYIIFSTNPVRRSEERPKIKDISSPLTIISGISYYTPGPGCSKAG